MQTWGPRLGSPQSAACVLTGFGRCPAPGDVETGSRGARSPGASSPQLARRRGRCEARSHVWVLLAPVRVWKAALPRAAHRQKRGLTVSVPVVPSSRPPRPLSPLYCAATLRPAWADVREKGKGCPAGHRRVPARRLTWLRRHCHRGLPLALATRQPSRWKENSMLSALSDIIHGQRQVARRGEPERHVYTDCFLLMRGETPRNRAAPASSGLCPDGDAV